MTDSKRFNEMAQTRSLTRRTIANALGITESSLYNKVYNRTEFTASELIKLFELFDLRSIEEQNRIFFTSVVE